MVDDLIRQLSQADLVVGYNHEHFDYGVLQRYTMWNMIDIKMCIRDRTLIYPLYLPDRNFKTQSGMN